MLAMHKSFLDFFTDPILRGPTVGCMLMCLAASLMGVIVFLRKESLLGESLSHAAYPGVILGIAIAGALELDDARESTISMLVMGGAFVSALFGLRVIAFLEQRLRVKNDAALCLVLSVFFGVGLTLASQVQFTHTVLYRQAQSYLFGQAATMHDAHIQIYAVLSLVIILATIFLYKELQLIVFDPSYAASLGIAVRAVNGALFLLIVLAVVIGIRSVGVVLMSAMLITPAAAARQFSNRLYIILPLAAFFGVASGFFGNYFSIALSSSIGQNGDMGRFALPTGPMIVMVASTICFLSLLFAPARGVAVRGMRIAAFRYKSLCENVMKTLWRFGPGKNVPLQEIAQHQSTSRFYLRLILANLRYNGWLEYVPQGCYRLTREGYVWGAKVVRLHRLWEVYLFDYLGVGAERVHRSAEEMEHIITPELEKELTLLLKDPKQDPHDQPIPTAELF